MYRALLVTLMATNLAHAEALSVREIVQRAVQRNPTLGSATADIGIATGALRAADGLDDFILDAGATWTRAKSAVIAGQPEQQPASDTVTLNLGLTKPLPSGGKIGLSTNGAWNRTEFLSGVTDPVSSKSENWTPGVNLSFSHPLLYGAGRAVARAQQIRSQAAKDVSVLAQTQVATLVVRDVIAAYWELVFANADRDIRRQAADAARDQLARTEANIKVGKLPPSASAEVKVSVALREEDMLVAERILLNRSMDLRELAGMDIQADNLITPTDSLEIEGEAPTFDRAVATAGQRNPDVLLAKGRSRAALVEVDAADTRPQLDFAVNGGPAGNADNPSDALDQLSKLKTYNVFASLIFHDSLGRNALLGVRDSALAGVQKARVASEQVERQVRSGIARQLAALTEAQRRIAVMQPAIGQASLDLDAEKARFDVGRATNFDVLRRQQELSDTQLRLARAKADYLRAEAALQALTGELLGRYGVSVSGTRGPTGAP